MASFIYLEYVFGVQALNICNLGTLHVFQIGLRKTVPDHNMYLWRFQSNSKTCMAKHLMLELKFARVHYWVYSCDSYMCQTSYEKTT